MSILKRLALAWTKSAYRAPLVSDVPRSEILFGALYGAPKKYLNYMRIRRSYRRQQLRVNGFPYEMRIDPTSVCNLRCPLCPTGTGEVDRGAGFISLDLYESVLDALGPFLFRVHLWAWGEPLLHKHLAQMVQMAHSRNIGTEVSTNLSIPLTDEAIDQLIESKLTWLIISNDAASKPTYDLYRLGGEFDLVTSNMKRIVERRQALRAELPFIEWQWVPLRQNQAEMSQAMEMARDLGIDGLRFKPVRVDKTDYVTFQGEIPRDKLDWVPDDPNLRHLVDHEDDSFLDFHCPFLWKSATIHFDGAIAPCCETYLKKDDFGRFGDGFSQIWNGDVYQKARRIALGRNLTDDDKQVPCYGCKVFAKPHRPSRVETQT